jgi:uncharacterized protein YjdB
MRISALVVAVVVALTACKETTAAKSAPLPDCTGDIHASPAEATLHPGDTLRLHAFVEPCPQDTFTSTFWWRSSDTSVAAADSITGLVRANSAGRATIVGSATVDSQLVVAAVVTVAPQ